MGSETPSASFATYAEERDETSFSAGLRVRSEPRVDRRDAPSVRRGTRFGHAGRRSLPLISRPRPRVSRNRGECNGLRRRTGAHNGRKSQTDRRASSVDRQRVLRVVVRCP